MTGSNLGAGELSTDGPDFPPMRPLLLPEPRQVPVVDHSRWSRRTHRWLYALSHLCFALGFIVVFAETTYYLVGSLLPPAPWFLIAAALMRAALSFDERRGQPAWAFRALIGALVVLVGFGAYLVWSANTDHLSSVRSPDGRFTAVVTDEVAMIDPVWKLTVHQNEGPLSRKWAVGCLNGDDPKNTYESIAWVDNTTLEVHTKNGQRIRARLSADGRPLNRVSSHDDSCP